MAGKPVHLTPHQFELLRVLARNEGKLLTHRMLLQEVWGPALRGRVATCSRCTSPTCAEESSPTRQGRATCSRSRAPATGWSIQRRARSKLHVSFRGRSESFKRTLGQTALPSSACSISLRSRSLPGASPSPSRSSTCWPDLMSAVRPRSVLVDRAAAVARLPGCSRLVRGERALRIRERAGDRPDPRLRGRAGRARLPARDLDGASLHGRAAAVRARSSAASSGSSAEIREQDWKGYGKTVLVFSVSFFLLLYVLQRVQGHLFLNPDDLEGVPAHISLNTAASFVTNTNWQYYGGEYTMSYLSQMAGLAVQNFVSAAVGMAVLAAVVRGLSRRSRDELGNFWRRPLPLARLHPAAARRRSSR